VRRDRRHPRYRGCARTALRRRNTPQYAIIDPPPWRRCGRPAARSSRAASCRPRRRRCWNSSPECAARCTCEEGTQVQWLRDLLVKRVARVVVCDQRGTPQRGNSGGIRATTRTLPSCRSCSARASCGRSATAAPIGRCSRSSRAATRLQRLVRRSAPAAGGVTAGPPAWPPVRCRPGRGSGTAGRLGSRRSAW
jgi:hypothetical protein